MTTDQNLDPVLSAMVRKFGDERCGLGLSPSDIERYALEGITGGDGDSLLSPLLLAEASVRRNIPLYHQGLLYPVAKKFANRGLDLDDLVSEGNLGLIRAARLYDPGRLVPDTGLPVRFCTYATHWIKHFVLMEWRASQCPIHIPRYIRAHIHAARKRGEANLEASSLKVAAKVRRYVADGEAVLAKTFHSGGSTSYLDGVPCRGESEGPRLSDDPVADVASLLRILTPRERALIEAKYGMNGRKGQSREMLATEYGISRWRVTDIRGEAMARMKEEAERRGLGTCA